MIPLKTNNFNHMKTLFFVAFSTLFGLTGFSQEPDKKDFSSGISQILETISEPVFTERTFEVNGNDLIEGSWNDLINEKITLCLHHNAFGQQNAAKPFSDRVILNLAEDASTSLALTIDGNQLHYKAITADGKLFDEFKIKKRANCKSKFVELGT